MTTSRQVRIELLGTFYSDLVTVLGDKGCTGHRLNEIFSKHVHGECVQCGIKITGEDMGRVALGEDKAEMPDPRLVRLRQGYCARKGCESYYYRILFDDSHELDWAKITNSADNRRSVAQSAAGQQKPEGSHAIRNWLLMRLGLGIALVLILVLVWRIRYYGYVPILQKPHKYTIDPASVHTNYSR